MTRVYLHDGLLRECSVALFFYSKKKSNGWTLISPTPTSRLRPLSLPLVFLRELGDCGPRRNTDSVGPETSSHVAQPSKGRSGVMGWMYGVPSDSSHSIKD